MIKNLNNIPSCHHKTSKQHPHQKKKTDNKRNSIIAGYFFSRFFLKKYKKKKYVCVQFYSVLLGFVRRRKSVKT